MPQANLSLARRALHAAGDEVPAAVQDFVRAMEAFYAEFVPQKFEAAVAAAAAREAEHALAHAEDVAELADAVVQVTTPPHCYDAEGVAAVSGLVRRQLEALAARGLALPALHVEHVRQAIDSAGMAFLAAPPDPDPGERLRWSEAVVSIQLAPLPLLGQCLASIARTINVEQLEDHARNRSAPSVESQRLLVAAIWAVKPECRCDSSWGDVRQLVGEGARSFVEALVGWDPLRDSSTDRLCRARELLLGLWRWAATGCGGSGALRTLFAWVSLAVALLPISIASQRLQNVHQRLRKGLAKVSEAAPEQAQKAKEKAWTAALFLLDSPDEEAWWWLRLIRPASSRTPWQDAEDMGDELGPPEALLESEGLASELAGDEGDGGKAFSFRGTAEEQHRAATRIQAVRRGRRGRRRARLHAAYRGTDREQAAAFSIQRWARAVRIRARIRLLAMRKYQEEAAALRIQTGWKVRKANYYMGLLRSYRGTEEQHDSATLIQSIQRGRKTREDWRNMIKALQEERRSHIEKLNRCHTWPEGRFGRRPDRERAEGAAESPERSARRRRSWPAESPRRLEGRLAWARQARKASGAWRQ